MSTFNFHSDEPVSNDPQFEPTVIQNLEEDELSIIAELVEVLS